MDDKDFLTIRRNLNILSVMILLLAYSSANISSFSFLGLSVNLDGEKFYQGLYIIYGYFIWRFITKLPYTSFKNDFDHFLLDPKRGLLKHFKFENIRKKINEVDNSFFVMHDIGAIRVDSMEVKRSHSKWKNIRIFIVYQFISDHPKSKDKTGSYHHIETNEIPVNSSIVFRKWIWFALTRDKFGDYLFPLIPVLFFLGFFFLKHSWQGSFSLIFLN